jgi:hypothetical protein
MLNFSDFDNTSGSFPNVEATDSSGPTLRDGTPINANLINDIWGAFQAILSAAGTTPSDGVETSSASDLLDSIRKLGGAPGEIVFHASPSDSIDANILPLKGQVITISAYQALVDATYVGDTNNPSGFVLGFFKCSDAGGTVRNTAGPYFRLPDCRGYFPRALAGAVTGIDAYRDYYTTLYGIDLRNMAGSLTGYSPGQHVHDVETADGEQVIAEINYVMRSNPGSVTGSAATVLTYPNTLYKRTTAAAEDLKTQIGREIPPVLIDYADNASYNEVYPRNVGFQLGIRY